MKLKVKIEETKKVPEEIYKQFLKLNFGENGEMKWTLKKQKSSRKKSYCGWIEVEGVVISWALLYRNSFVYSNFWMMFYTMRAFRRRGLAKRIFIELSKMTKKKVNVFENVGNTKFFRKLPKEKFISDYV